MSKFKGRLPPFVPVFRHTIKTPAWRALSVGGRATFLVLKANYNTNSQNAVFLSARDASKEFGVSKNTAARWLHELEHYGFIVLVQGAHLGVSGTGKAARYRLTDCWYAGKQPTYDFQNWDGVLFDPPKHVMTKADKERRKRERKKQNPVPTAGTPCPNGRDIRAETGKAGNGNKRPYGRDIRAADECPNGRDITSFNHSLDLPASLLEWSIPTLTEMAYTPILRQLYATQLEAAA